MRVLFDVARDKFNIQSPFVLTVGDLQPRKNQIGLIRAFEELIAAHPQLPHQLVIVGKKTWFADRIMDAAKSSRVADRIVFTGFVNDDDLLQIYNACDLMVFPSFYEGFGLPILEAMACGRAVACSNTSSMPEVANAAALLFDPGNLGEIVRAMRDVLLDPELRIRMERLGLHRASLFTWERTAQKTLELYHEVAGAKSPESANHPEYSCFPLMKTFGLLFLAVGLFAQSHPVAPKKPAAAAEIAKASQVPAPEAKAKKSETLHYNVNWPSGLSLGEADLTHSVGESGVNSTFRMDASVPGFAISENVSSRATAQYCSIELKKQGVRGKRKVDERTEFDPAKLTATRTTEGGGKSELSTSTCAKDALAFVQFRPEGTGSGPITSATEGLLWRRLRCSCDLCRYTADLCRRGICRHR